MTVSTPKPDFESTRHTQSTPRWPRKKKTQQSLRETPATMSLTSGKKIPVHPAETRPQTDASASLEVLHQKQCA